MREWKRIFVSKTFLAVLLLLTAGSLLFYGRLQRERTPVPMQEYRQEHRAWQARLAGLAPEEGILALDRAQEELLSWSLAGYLIQLRQEDRSQYAQQAEAMQERHPELEQYIQRLEAGAAAPGAGASLAAERWKARLTYLSGYQASLEKIQQQAQDMKKVSIFSDPDSFAYRNIEKTVRDFSAMQGRALSPGNDEIVLSVLEDRSGPICSLLLLLTAVILCLDEQRRSLRGAVFATGGGRGRLALWRFGALGVASLIAVAVFYGAKLLAAMGFYGEAIDLSRLVQSMEVFRYFPIPINVGTFLLLYGFLQFLGAWLMGLLLWTVLTYLPRNLGLILSAIFLALEYYWFANLKATDALPWLRGINLFTFASMLPVFTRYLNYEVFGILIWEPLLALLVLMLLLMICAGLCIWGQARRRPKESSSLSRWFSALRLTRRSKRGLPPVLTEWRKAWVSNRGLLVLAVFFLYTWTQVALPQPPLEQKDAILNQYCQKYQGPATQEKQAQLNQELENAKRQYAELLDSMQEAGAGAELFYASELSYSLAQVQALEELTSRTQALLELPRENLWVLGELPYETLFGKTSFSWRLQNQVVTLLASILLLIPIFGYETHSRTRTFLQTLPTGRTKVIQHKLYIALGTIIFLWLASSAREWQLICGAWGGFPGWQASGWSLRHWDAGMRAFPIAAHLAILYLCRLLGLLGAGMIVLLVSCCLSSQLGGIGLSAVLLILPSFLSSMSGGSWLSAAAWANQLAGMDLSPRAGPPMIWGVIGCVAVWMTSKRWRRYRA